MAEKYASWSPYNYVLGNPLKFVDIEGKYVDYGENEAARQHVENARQQSEAFAAVLKILEASDVVYSFNFLGEQDYKESAKKGSTDAAYFSSDGEKVYINFHLIVNGISDGEFTSLFHESEHAMQFEHGEIGFASTKVKDAESGEDKVAWQAIFYDITDEVKAFEKGMSAPGASKDKLAKFQRKSEEQKMKYVSDRSSTYKTLYRKAQERMNAAVPMPAEERNMSSKQELIKTDKVFVKPYKLRQNE